MEEVNESFAKIFQNFNSEAEFEGIERADLIDID